MSSSLNLSNSSLSSYTELITSTVRRLKFIYILLGIDTLMIGAIFTANQNSQILLKRNSKTKRIPVIQNEKFLTSTVKL